jgi:hypothetical protein
VRAGLVVGSAVASLRWCGYSAAAAHLVVASTGCPIAECNFLSSHDGMQRLGKCPTPESWP